MYSGLMVPRGTGAGIRGAVLVLLAGTSVAGCALVRRGGPERVESAPPASSPARAAMAPRNGLEVVGAMRRAHPSRALRSVAFTLVITEFRADAPRADSGRARTVAALPGKFRVATLPASRRTGYVHNQQRLAVFERGRRVASQNAVDLTKLLAYDVFAQGIDTTIKWLDIARVRFGLARRDRFGGRPVWVVGALPDDTVSAQFWVDAERWHLVRVIQRDPRAPGELVDTRFTEFTRVLEVPLPTRIEVYRGGKLRQQHVVGDVVPNPAIPSNAFDVSRWRDVLVAN